MHLRIMHALHEEDHMHEKHGHDLSRDDLIREAKMQTDAIQRLNVWLRLGYSLVAIGFLMGMWGMQEAPAGCPRGHRVPSGGHSAFDRA